MDRHNWIDIGDLYVGERLRLLDGTLATVERIQIEMAPCLDPDWSGGTPTVGRLGALANPETGTFTTYNFEVSDWHTYFAAPKGERNVTHAVWVHNMNVGVCKEGKDFLQRLKDQGVPPNVRRKAFESRLRQHADNPLDGTTYTAKVQGQMRPNLRTGIPENHGFPRIVDNYAGQGKQSVFQGGDGVWRTKVELPGSYRGKNGVFEGIIEPDGFVNHRFFRAMD